LASAGRIFTDNNGDLAKIAATWGLSLDALKGDNPTTAEKFAENLLKGFFTADQDEEAKSKLRQQLSSTVRRASTTLKKTTTKEIEGQPSAGELASAGRIFTDNNGDLAKIAATWGLSLDALKGDNPTTAEKFAENLLKGFFTADQDEEAKSKLRQQLSSAVRRASSTLKKTATKEFVGPSEAEVAAVAAALPAELGQLPAFAASLGIAPELLKQHAPTDRDDFARKVLAGVYTQDQTETAKADFRSKLGREITKQVVNLKTVRPRRMSNVSDDEHKSFAKFYTKHGGDLFKISADTGITMELLVNAAPVNADDFAQNLLEGKYTVDMCAHARATLRTGMRTDLAQRRSSLTKVTTKEWDGAANAKDIAMLVEVYNGCKGDVFAISKSCGLSLPAMSRDPPRSAEEFGKKVLLGCYTTDKVAAVQRELRVDLIKTLKSTMTLKRTHTKVGLDAPDAGEVAVAAKIFNDLRGDPERLIKAFGANPEAINQAAKEGKLSDANDFALKLLAGHYSTNFASYSSEGVQERLRLLLQDSLIKSKDLKAGLKRSNTKEGTGAPADEDIAAVAEVWTKHGADPKKVAEHLGCDEALLTKDAPKDPKAFAQKFLSGGYQSVHDE